MFSVCCVGDPALLCSQAQLRTSLSSQHSNTTFESLCQDWAQPLNLLLLCLGCDIVKRCDSICLWQLTGTRALPWPPFFFVQIHSNLVIFSEVITKNVQCHHTHPLACSCTSVATVVMVFILFFQGFSNIDDFILHGCAGNKSFLIQAPELS